ncbi:LPXTG cell wall anchor domain-containing protein [Bacillus thuringiensis]|uniref:LPXTG cell wall anchor domain-containing protein n=1 Tax=Bacillus thuringiensis TaxID=1428 RepID=UPI0021E76FDE|nr:LPXTG cell wall anchor domain-containing protein [Bacillus thuringiensis]
MKKIACCIAVTLICAPFITLKAANASSMNSKAGITFSNSYTPVTSTDPTETKIKEETVDKNGTRIIKEKDKNGDKHLPKTGGQTRDFTPYIGLFSITLSLYVFKRIRGKQVYSK